jgi:hypothetical protein
MKSLQEVFNQIQIIKKQQKDLKAVYREALDKMPEYKEAVDALKMLREKKKQLEEVTKSEFSKEFDKLDELKMELEEQNMMLTDITMSQIMKGESVEIVDQYHNIYEPAFAVRFKKTMVISEGTEEKQATVAAPIPAAASDIPQVNLF